MNNRPDDDVAVLANNILTEELTEEEIKHHANKYFTSIESNSNTCRNKHDNKRIIDLFFQLILNSNNPYLKLLSQNVSTLEMLCEAWFERSGYLKKYISNENDVQYLINFLEAILNKNREKYIVKILKAYDLGLISEAKCREAFIETDCSEGKLHYRYRIGNKEYSGCLCPAAQPLVYINGKYTEPTNTTIITHKKEFFPGILHSILSEQDCLPIYHASKMNIAFLEFWAFVLTENPDEPNLNKPKKYFGEFIPAHEDMLKFGYIKNISSDDGKKNFNPQFMHPLFQSYFCARYLVSCVLTDLNEISLTLNNYNHRMNTELGYFSIKQFISHHTYDESNQQIWMFAEEMLRINGLEKLINYFPIRKKNNVFNLVNDLVQKKYAWNIQRVNENELKIAYVKSNDPLRILIHKYNELEAILKNWLADNHLSDEVSLILDDDYPIFNISSQKKSNIDKILTWLDQIESYYTKQNAVQSRKIHSFFFNQDKTGLRNDNQINNELKIECNLF